MVTRYIPIDPEFAGQTTVEVLRAFSKARSKQQPFEQPYAPQQHKRSFGGCDVRVAEFARRVVMPAIARCVRAA